MLDYSCRPKSLSTESGFKKNRTLMVHTIRLSLYFVRCFSVVLLIWDNSLTTAYVANRILKYHFKISVLQVYAVLSYISWCLNSWEI